jgi:hypothetical protein
MRKRACSIQITPGIVEGGNMFNHLYRKSEKPRTMRIPCLVTAWFLATATFSASPSIAQSPQGGKLKVQIIYLGRGGCQPSEIHHKGGNFRLYVVNLSPTRDLQLTFHPESANAASISNKNVKDDDHEWIQTIDVHPGRYLLEATNSPEHHCSVVVE